MALAATLQLPTEVLEELAALVAVHVAGQIEPASKWLTVAAAADYLATTPGALRGAVKRRQVPFHKVNGRLLFDRRELDAWVRGEAA